MKLKITLLFYFFIQFVSAQNSIDEIKNNIIGKWEWKSSHFVTQVRTYNTEETPLTCMCSKRIEFINDRILREYRNDSLLYESDFSLEAPNYYYGRSKAIMRNNHLDGPVIIYGDTMILGDWGGCGDLIQRYVKLK